MLLPCFGPSLIANHLFVWIKPSSQFGVALWSRQYWRIHWLMQEPATPAVSLCPPALLWGQAVMHAGFPAGSADKESFCKAGVPSSIPGLRRSLGERKGYPLQFSWPCLVAQMVKNPPALWETWVQSLGWEDSLEEGMQPTPVFLPGESPWTEEPDRLQSMGSQRVRHDWVTEHSPAQSCMCF